MFQFFIEPYGDYRLNVQQCTLALVWSGRKILIIIELEMARWDRRDRFVRFLGDFCLALIGESTSSTEAAGDVPAPMQ